VSLDNRGPHTGWVSAGAPAPLAGGGLFLYLSPHRDECHAPHATANDGIADRDAKQVATCLGYSPRFLHSTGPAYKGGPHTGVFLQNTCDNVTDLPVPGQKYTFGVVKAVQVRGDFHVLAERGRQALRTHVGQDVQAGLAGLQALTCSGARHQATSPSCHARDGRSSLWGPHKPSCLSAMKEC
jgi:hypothetical protein